MKIEKAQEKDCEKLVELEKEYVKLHKELDSAFEFKKTISKIWLPYLKKCLKDKNFRVLIAKDKEDVVGYAMAKITELSPIYKTEKAVSVLDLYMGKKYDRKTVSKAFIQEIINWAKKNKVKRIQHSVSAKDRVREELSKEMGFEDYILILRKEI